MDENRNNQTPNYIPNKKRRRPKKENLCNSENSLTNSAGQTLASLLTKKRGRPTKNAFDMHKIQQSQNSGVQLFIVDQNSAPSHQFSTPAATTIPPKAQSVKSNRTPISDISNLNGNRELVNPTAGQTTTALLIKKPGMPIKNAFGLHKIQQSQNLGVQFSKMGQHSAPLHQFSTKDVTQSIIDNVTPLTHLSSNTAAPNIPSKEQSVKSIRTPLTDISNLTDAGRRRSIMSKWKPKKFPSATSLDIPPYTENKRSDTIESIKSKRCNKENRRGIFVCVPFVSSIDIPIPGTTKIPTSENPHDVSSSSGKNLLESFNDADDMETDIDDPEYHRGEYTSDFEFGSDTLQEDLWAEYMDLGKPDKICTKCKAYMWNQECNNKSAKYSVPTFSICYKNGHIQLPEERRPPQFLASLLAGGPKTSHFKHCIRTYNSLFACTSLGGKIDHKINNGGAPYCFKLCGQNYHLLGSMLPKDGDTPKFCQLYIYDTENEIQNRLNVVPGSDCTNPDFVEGLLKMLDENNKLVEGFHMVRDRFDLKYPEEFSLVLLSSKAASGRPNHVIQSKEVVALIVGDIEETDGFKDIVVQTKNKFF
ncbi:hypothetical protein POM88_014336 [Heracleum sosnowskyi]|uniref:Helitron helicase-like domain-containing protein n=1 Tax=Heracleum sosnowskyi TaxID=360622 RepID=A0AAD8MYW6_9APIA|nr:hypothetical protein POM88_014336 [Heracleum sosnowskyi]